MTLMVHWECFLFHSHSSPWTSDPAPYVASVSGYDLLWEVWSRLRLEVLNWLNHIRQVERVKLSCRSVRESHYKTSVYLQYSAGNFLKHEEFYAEFGGFDAARSSSCSGSRGSWGNVHRSVVFSVQWVGAFWSPPLLHVSWWDLGKIKKSTYTSNTFFCHFRFFLYPTDTCLR